MLVLDRRIGESISIEDVTVTILRIGKTYVKVGIQAHKDVRIVRTELTSKQESSSGSDKAAVDLE